MNLAREASSTASVADIAAAMRALTALGAAAGQDFEVREWTMKRHLKLISPTHQVSRDTPAAMRALAARLGVAAAGHNFKVRLLRLGEILRGHCILIDCR